jgi:hypothetical protein
MKNKIFLLPAAVAAESEDLSDQRDQENVKAEPNMFASSAK